MAVPNNTYVSASAVGNREDLGNEIYMISPVDTLFTSKIGEATGGATATKHEWTIDALAAAGDNAASEGDTTAAEAVTPTTRIYNTCQIQKKVFSISGSQEKVKKAGQQSEVDRQTYKKQQELAKDIEYAFMRGVRSDNDPRKMRGALNWCTTNLGKAEDATLNADGTVTGGTARPLTETLVKEQLQNTFTQGGNIDTILCGPFQKSAISGFVNTGNTRRTMEEKKLINSVDVYESDFSVIAIKPHRNMPTDVIFGVDHKYWKKATLRSLFREQLAKTGDSLPYHIVIEHTLEACNEASSFRITNLLTSAT